MSNTMCGQHTEQLGARKFTVALSKCSPGPCWKNSDLGAFEKCHLKFQVENLTSV